MTLVVVVVVEEQKESLVVEVTLFTPYESEGNYV